MSKKRAKRSRPAVNKKKRSLFDCERDQVPFYPPSFARMPLEERLYYIHLWNSD